MRLIDADSLTDELAREPMNTRTYSRASELVIEEPTVKAIPLDKIKQAKEEIEHLDGTTDDYNKNGEVVFRNMVDVAEVLAILDRLIEREE